MPIDFNPAKDEENQRKHGLPLEAALLVFEGPFVEEPDSRVDYGETRLVATGPVSEFGDRICVVVYTWRDGIRRVINFRKANDREVRKYQAGLTQRGQGGGQGVGHS